MNVFKTRSLSEAVIYSLYEDKLAIRDSFIFVTDQISVVWRDLN